MLNNILRGIGLLLVIVFIVSMLGLAVIWGLADYRIDRNYNITPEQVVVPTDPESITNGERLMSVHGCLGCHGENLAGKVFFDQPRIGYLESTNLTPGKNGVGSTYNDVDWVRAIRHGVGPTGRPLVIMPSSEYYYLTDADLGDMIAYLKTLPPVDSDPKPARLDIIIRISWALIPGLPVLSAELIDHTGPRPADPVPGITVEYGKYLAITCTNCHGAGFSGGPMPGRPPEPGVPDPANLTPNTQTGLGNWTEEDFFRAIREGKRPNGSALSDAMPWKEFRAMTDDELSALWMFLQTLPAKEWGNR